MSLTGIESDKVETYLAEVTKRLFDTQRALEGALVFCRSRKSVLITEGKGFDYDQGSIDIAMEIYRYATGEDDLQEIIDLMENQQQKVRKSMQGGQQPGMEFM